MEYRPMNTLVIGGMHGNEPLGVQLIRLLQAKPLPHIDLLVANPRAVRARTRFTEQDLNRVFPGAAAGTYEQRRARTVLDKLRRYDLVLDFHNTLANQPSCGFVGPTYTGGLLAIASRLGIKHVIEADYDCINKYAPNCLSVEICVQESDASAWYRKLQNMQAGPAAMPKVYRYLRRVTWEESRGLTSAKWQPFEEIMQRDKQVLGLTGSACPIFIGSTLTEYYATLIGLVDTPSGTIGVKERT